MAETAKRRGRGGGSDPAQKEKGPFTRNVERPKSREETPRKGSEMEGLCLPLASLNIALHCTKIKTLRTLRQCVQ